MAEMNSVGGFDFNMSFNNVKYVAKKYGEHSYMVAIINRLLIIMMKIMKLGSRRLMSVQRGKLLGKQLNS